jgi:antitoxin MazE
MNSGDHGGVTGAWERLVFQDGRVFKAGNSLAIRIPSAVAKSVGLEDGASVDMAVEDGLILIRRATPHRLADLIARISPQNVHADEFDELIESERW